MSPLAAVVVLRRASLSKPTAKSSRRASAAAPAASPWLAITEMARWTATDFNQRVGELAKGLLHLGAEQRGKQAERENDREPDLPHGHLVGMAGGSLANDG